ncbi:MAG: hypothetical protein J6B68_03995 [Lachnospiraceae bacterium]|nr:hypothetical protein [Lachnospiraceae bacterium]
MEMLEQIKLSMRISHHALDDVILADMEVAAHDLLRVGVNPYQLNQTEEKVIKEDALIYKAMELYVKAQVDFEGKGESYNSSYEKLRDSLALSGDYNE